MNKKIKIIKDLVEQNKFYSVREAVNFFLEYRRKSMSNFNETIDVSFKINMPVEKNSKQIYSSFALLSRDVGGSSRIIAVIDKELKQQAIDMGANVVGGEELMHNIVNKVERFDYFLTTPDLIRNMSSELKKALVLKGIMPNLKDGTISSDVIGMIKKIKKGAIRYKFDKNCVLNTKVAKLDFSCNEVVQNIISVKNSLSNIKCGKISGFSLKYAFLSTTQGPSIKLDLKSIMD